MKTCVDCGIEKSLTEYYRANITGYHIRCKRCHWIKYKPAHREAMKRYREKHRKPKPTERTCDVCGETKPLLAFRKRGNNGSPTCRPCRVIEGEKKFRAHTAAMLTRTEKKCHACGEIKLLSEFGSHKGKTGLARTSKCKPCMVLASKAWRRANKDLARKLEKERRQKLVAQNRGKPPAQERHCTVCGLVKPASAFHRNPTETTGLHHKCKACRTKWVKANRSLFVDYAHRRRVRVLGNGPIEKIDRDKLYVQVGGKCCVCRRKVSAKNFHVEHWMPVSKGGTHTHENVGIAHPKCNLSKGVKVLPKQLTLSA